MWFVYLFIGFILSIIVTYVFSTASSSFRARPGMFGRETNENGKSIYRSVLLFVINLLMYLSGLAVSIFSPEIRVLLGY